MTFAEIMALHGCARLTLRYLYRRKLRSPMLCIDTTSICLLSANHSYKRYGSSYGGPPLPGQVGPPLDVTEETGGKASPREEEQNFRWKLTLFKMFESAATTFMSIMVLGLVLSSFVKDWPW